MRSIDAAPMPIAVGIVRKIPVHLMLLSKAEVKTGSAQIALKLSKPTHVGGDAPSQSTKAMQIVRKAGTRMMRTLMRSAGNRKSIGDLRGD